MFTATPPAHLNLTAVLAIARFTRQENRSHDETTTAPTRHYALSGAISNLEPPTGIEPVTYALRERRSAY